MGQSCGQNPIDPDVCCQGAGHRGLQVSVPNFATHIQVTADERSNGAEHSCANDSLPIRSKMFAISRSAHHDWYDEYLKQSRIGQGVSANVFLAQASSPRASPRIGCVALESSILCHRSSAFFGRGANRQVAIKRFRNKGAASFDLELKAHCRVGVHPNVVRLLECFHNGTDEDVLVYEYCDSCTVWDVFKNEDCLPKVFVLRILRQLLLALEHVHSCGVEHQDVKPENMLLYDLVIEDQQASLKLADFGWATTGPWLSNKKLPRSGIGSLWYAAPEMNPPPKRNKRPTRPSETNVSAVMAAHAARQARAAEARDDLAQNSSELISKHATPVGLSDMWSVGVVTYFLLVGQHPFALDPKQLAAEPVLDDEELSLGEGLLPGLPFSCSMPSSLSAKLKGSHREASVEDLVQAVSEGKFDTCCERWIDMAIDLQSFISSCLEVEPTLRPRAAAVLRCSQVFAAIAHCDESRSLMLEAHVLDLNDAWDRLHRFEQLAWLALARASTEPEIHYEVIATAHKASRVNAKTPHSYETGDGAAALCDDTYLFELARVISFLPIDKWLKVPIVLPEILRVAFCYLDTDGDGVLSIRDLVQHIDVESSSSNEARAAARSWIARWKVFSHDTVLQKYGLKPAEFQRVFFASRDASQSPWAEVLEATPSGEGACCRGSGGFAYMPFDGNGQETITAK